MNITLKIFAVAAILAGASDGFCPITQGDIDFAKERCTALGDMVKKPLA